MSQEHATSYFSDKLLTSVANLLKIVTSTDKEKQMKLNCPCCGNKLKLYFGHSVAVASSEQMDELNNQLLKQFGDRLLMARIHRGDTFRGTITSYSVYLVK